MDANALIHVEHLKKYFDLHKRGTLMAVDDVSFAEKQPVDGR